jgi:methionyl-tRNA formyltransferase
MRVLFMGTPDFAACSLRRLYLDGHDVCGVFTQPDKPKNRGMKMTFSPVKEEAVAHGTAVYQPEKLRDGTALKIIKELAPEIIVAVAYGKILPKDILEFPKFGCINIHGSILPKYRGSAPIQWAVLNGEKETGVTSMYMAEAMDAGDIIDIKKTGIGENETAGELFDRLMLMGADLLSDTLRDISEGIIRRTPQNEAEATFAPMLTKELCPIDWAKNPEEILNQIRGLDPWPVATAEFNGIKFKIFKAEKKPDNSGKAPGEIISTDKSGLTVACSGGAVLITELQAAGGKRMRAADYLRGHPIN